MTNDGSHEEEKNYTIERNDCLKNSLARLIQLNEFPILLSLSSSLKILQLVALVDFGYFIRHAIGRAIQFLLQEVTRGQGLE